MKASGARQDATLADTAATLAIAVTTTAAPIVGHLAGQPVGLALCAGLAALVASYAVAAVPATLVCSCIFQNFFIALVSPELAGPEDFNSIRVYNFVATVVIWAVLCAGYWSRPVGERSHAGLMSASSVVLGLVAVYFAVGAMGDAKSATIYLRNIATPFLLFQVGLVAATRRAGPLTQGLPALAVAALVYGYLELIGRGDFLALVHGDVYLGYSMREQIESPIWLKELRETGRVVRGLDDMLSIDFLNMPFFSDIGFKLYRLMGPNFHAISFGYALAVMSLLRLQAGRPLYALAAFPLLLAIGSKGSLVLLVFAGAALVVQAARPSRLVFAGLALALAGLSLVAIVTGLSRGDYHALGLVGGLNGFVANPLGHGLGSGGNLAMNMARIDWSRSQALGQTNVAVESAVGVVLYQMGVAGFAVWLAPVGFALAAFRAGLGQPGLALPAAAFSVLAVAANALLQEEALFAPLAMGLCLLLTGLALGGTRSAAVAARGVPTVSPAVARPLGAGLR